MLRLLCLALCFWIFGTQPLLAAEPVEIKAEGIEGDALKNVREALALPYGLIHDGKVDRLWLERFARQADEKVRTALEPFGYYTARITTTIEPIGEERYRLHVKVEPGEPVRVGEVEVAVRGPGAKEEPIKEVVAAFPLRKDDVLLQKRYEEAKGTLKARAMELGYLDAEFSVHEIRIAKDRTTARIELVMDTGPQYLFNGVTLKGAPDYPEKFLRRYVAFKPGDIFSYGKLGETQLNFTNSERFKEVIVTPEKEEAQELRVPVLVQLKPAPRRQLRPGLGYGTDTGGRFSLVYRDLNMFHLGQELNIQLYVAERLQGLAVGYIFPSARDIKSFTGLQLNLQRQDVTTYLSQLVSLEVNRNRSFGPGQLGTAYLRVQQEDFTIGDQKSSSRIVLPGLRFSENRYGDVVRPVQGHRYVFDLRGTHQFLGSSTGLLQLVAEGSALVPLPWRLSLLTRVNGGITVQNGPLSDLPASLRFFTGGDRSVRGYSYQTLGPRDATGKVVGGRHLFVGSVELERALFQDWGVSAFYDAGNAFNSFTAIHLFQGAGGGVHYYSPLGGLSLYLARQIGVDKPGFHIHFIVGFQL